MAAPPGQPGLRVLLVDDEAPARTLLREMLGGHPRWTIVGEARNGLEAVRLTRELAPDLVLLDVQMPKLDGFEAIELFDPKIAVVFTTAHDEHAVRAFEVNAVDYLLKPFSPERFAHALRRAEGRLGTDRGFAPDALARAARPADRHLERIVVREGGKIEIIPVDRLDYAQSRDDYVELFFDGRALLKEQTLQSLEADLDPRRFVRIHRSYLLNLDRLARVEAGVADGKIAVLKDGRQLPLSRSGDGRLRRILESR